MVCDICNFDFHFKEQEQAHVPAQGRLSSCSGIILSQVHSTNSSSEPQDHRTRQLQSPILHAYLSGHWVATAMFALITLLQTSKDDHKKPRIEDISNFINIFHANYIQVLNMHGYFGDFRGVLQMEFRKLMKKMGLVLEPLFKDRKVLWTKQTQLKSNAKRGWPIELVNHIQP